MWILDDTTGQLGLELEVLSLVQNNPIPLDLEHDTLMFFNPVFPIISFMVRHVSLFGDFVARCCQNILR
jgi:hypothetical protein